MYAPHGLNMDRLERYHDLSVRKYPLRGMNSLPIDLSAMKTSTWTYKPAAPLPAINPAATVEKQMKFRPEKAHRRPVQRLQWRKNPWQNEFEEPSNYLDLNRISSMTIADVSPKFAVKRIVMMYENVQYKEAANFINRLSHGTFKVILTDLPVDVFIESMPDSLPILEALYAKVFLSDGLNFSVKTLKPDAVVMQMVKFFAQQEESLTGHIKRDQCAPFIASCKKLLKVIVHTDPKIRKLLTSRKKALEKAIEGMGHHGMVGTSDGSLMNLHDALKLEFQRVVTSYKAALEKLEELSLSTSSKQTLSRSISYGPAPIQASHQRQLSITQEDIQERLIKNKTILNVVEPILGNHSLDVFLGILQRRIDYDKDCMFHFTQLKKEVKDISDASVVAPILMRYAHGIEQVLKLMREVSGDQEESDGSDISGYHSDSDSAIMTSGNSPYVSKSARYNFLYRSVRATPAQFRGSIPAFSVPASSTAGSLHSGGSGSVPCSASETTSVGEKSANGSSPHVESKGRLQRKRKEIEKRDSNSSADMVVSSDSEMVCLSGHTLPIPGSAAPPPPPPAAQQPRGKEAHLTSPEVTQNDTKGGQPRHERQLKLRLSEHQRKVETGGGSRTENVTNITIDNQWASLLRRYGNLYVQDRAQAMDALDSLPELRNSDELKSKLLFSVVVLAFRSAGSTQQAVRETVRRQLQIPPPPPQPDLPRPPGRGQGSESERSARLEKTITGFLQQTVDTYDLSNNVEEVCNQIWATLYDYPSLRTSEGLLSYVKECVRLAWGLINQVPPCRIEYEVRTYNPELHVRYATSDAGQGAVQTYLWPALLEEAGGCLHKAVVIT